MSVSMHPRQRRQISQQRDEIEFGSGDDLCRAAHAIVGSVAVPDGLVDLGEDVVDAAPGIDHLVVGEGCVGHQS